jgi:hypothetical protein
MGVRLTVFLDGEEEEKRLFDCYVRHPPRAGEYLWLTGNVEAAHLRATHGTSSFIVASVAHWVSPNHVPPADQDPIHTMAAFVTPVFADAALPAPESEYRRNGESE